MADPLLPGAGSHRADDGPDEEVAAADAGPGAPPTSEGFGLGGEEHTADEDAPAEEDESEQDRAEAAAEGPLGDQR
ncbi:hypothetical protein [Kineococcus sp. SYSU DK004]|uniref:hypothetical protein n=1 Tax=Kineococcus sp. SYSU DK004 TaxID=3383125 RepID=UPI003D7C57CA